MKKSPNQCSENLKNTVNAVVEGSAYMGVSLDEDGTPTVFCHSDIPEASFMLAVLQNYLNERINECR